MTETKQTPLSVASSGPNSAVQKKEEYKVLKQVADEMNFDLDSLITMYMTESSGDTNAVNDLGYVGGFQFGKVAGEKYNLINDSGDFRKDLRKSAVAAVKFSRENLSDEILMKSGKKMSFEKLLSDHDIPKDLGFYLAHQQGRTGLVDILTGAKSGNIGDSTMKNMSTNMGFNEEEREEFKANEKRGDSAKVYLEEWKTRWKGKQKEASDWKAVGAPAEDKIINTMLKEEGPVVIQPDKTQ